MRVSTSQTTALLLKSLQSQYSEYTQVAEQLSTGSSINKPSDNAIGYARVSNLTSQQTQLEQYIENIETASSQLSASETQYSSMTDVMGSIRDLVVQAANGTYDSEDLANIATEISGLMDTMVDLCNQTDAGGNYLFSGSLSDTAPVVYDEATNTYSYAGDDYQREVSVGDGMTVASTDNLSDVFFSGGSSFFDDLNGLVAALASGDNTSASSMLDTIDSASSNLSSAIASIGARSNQLDTLSSSHSETLLYSEELSASISEADYAETTLRSEEILTTLQVTQQVLSSVLGLSLFDEL